MLRKVMTMVLLVAAVGLAGCSSHKREKPMAAKNRFGESLAGFQGKGSAYYNGRGPVPRGGGKFHVGKPYQVAGRWFTPKAQPGYDKKGAASWYGEAFHRRRTSNGEYFDMNMLTAAHPTLPLPSYARVTNVENGNVVVVRINDRGPFVGSRIIDLSKGSAEALDFKKRGKATVRVQWIGNAPLNDKGSHLAMMNRRAKAGAGMRALVASAVGQSGGRDQDIQIADAQPDENFQQASFEIKKPQKQQYGVAKIIQVGSFQELAAAEQARASLSAFGPVQVFEWESNDGPVFKVQVGPFVSDISAANALDDVREQGYSDAVIQTARIEQVAFNR